MLKTTEFWHAIPCSWIEILSIVKIYILPNFIYRFNTIIIKILAWYFGDIDKLILKFTHQGKRPRIANTISKMKKMENLYYLISKPTINL